MTSEDRRLDDAEFEAFLQGHGELARQLQGLPQPAPSAALDAAILAQAETMLKTETPLQQAANDALSGKPGKAAKPRFLMRWSTQLGMAACMVLAVLVTLRWQTEPATQSYDTAPQAEPAPPPAAPAAAPAPSVKSVEPVEKKAQAKPDLARPKAAARSAPPAAKAAPEAKSPTQAQDTQAAPAPTPAPIAGRENYAVSPSQLANPENLPSKARAIIVPRAAVTASQPSAIADPAAAYSPAPAPIVAPPAPTYSSAPAPAIASGATAAAAPTESESASVATQPGKPESPARAEAWLSVIDQMLKAGLRQDALEEWEKFRHAYPGYPVPEKLRAQIRLQQK
ncbi:hypothetical protein CFter6_3243 [Collimonas fungivorans]|jgi:hypothetical protein|uniref:Uncharacterized protein n=1 Tax=Collimonas fungivorans TaxID=158899 RepID=A0A127PDL5_9BURK|nr:hypothetical protein [Collimonas fungivorans]AMO95889.1 hypothetical protein CFter6_3243 [Collimonas fungivorans]